MAPLLLLLVLLLPATVHAQRRQVSLEANPVHGTLGYGWARSPSTFIGVEVGFGFPQLDRTLAPEGDDSFMDMLHLGVFVRTNPTQRLTFDARAQAGLAELRGCSGCFPGVFLGTSGAVFWGGRRVKVGPRIKVGMINEQQGNPVIVSLTPIAVHFNYTW
jgi:hypothetical protein